MNYPIYSKSEQIMNPKVSIVILNYKNYHDTIECVKSIFVDSFNFYQLIIVDNNSQNNSITHIKKWFQNKQIHTTTLDENQIGEVNKEIAKNIILIQAHGNRGYAAGNNLGIKLALKTHPEYILIINNDILVETDSIINLVDFMNNHPEAGVVGPKIVDEKGKIDHSCARRRPKLLDYFFRLGIGRLFSPQNRWVSYHYYLGEYHFDFPKKVDIVSGACMLIRKRVFSEIGLLDENTFLYWEEAILHENLRNTKMHTFIVPQSRIVHKKGSSVAGLPGSLQAKIVLRSLCYYLTSYRKCNKIITYLLMASVYLTYRLKILKNHLFST